MEERGVRVKVRASASQKLKQKDAELLLVSAERLYVAKGRTWREFSGDELLGAEATAAMLGPTGNLRAPTLRAGKTLLVGYHEETYAKVWGA